MQPGARDNSCPMDPKIFYDGWEGPARVALFGMLTYLFLVALLRVTGKRTLSKMNAFDFIITVASGSTFAAVLLNKSVTLAEGVVAFLMLVFMQLAVAWSSSRSKTVEDLVKSTPTVLVWRGQILHEVMVGERVSEAEVLAACRQSGASSLDEVHAVVLETAGTFSVLKNAPDCPEERSTLRTVDAIPGGQ